MISIQDFVLWGLDREVPELLDYQPRGGHPALNLGPGSVKGIPGTTGLGDRSEKYTDIEWRAPEPLPYHDDSVAAVHAHQFMEHLAYEDAIAVLREVERVLVPGGVMLMTTPYPTSQHFTQALDHKTMWTEETWNWLFTNDYYKPAGDWRLKVHACFLFAVVYRNLDMFTQLVKEA